MKDIRKTAADIIKNPKILVVIGLCGILLIALSGFFGKNESNTAAEPTTAASLSSQEYRQSLEEQLKTAIAHVTGGRVNVVVTLSSDIEYIYASEGKSQSSEQSENNDSKVQKGNGVENSYVIVKDSGGNETPLIVTAVMPSIKGAVINCEGGDDPSVKYAVTSIVTTALDIDENKVCVTGYYQ